MGAWIGANKQWTQQFKNDHLGRLKEAAEYRGDNGQLSYRQKFEHDRFGNVHRKAASNPPAGQQSPLPFTPIEDADVSRSTNRFTANTGYDAAGNPTQDNKFRSINMAYDANGRVHATSGAQGGNSSNSAYDAGGQRVATQVNGVWTFHVYDIGGKMVAEHGGRETADNGGVQSLVEDEDVLLEATAE